MGNFKDKMYFYFVEKNWGVRREYKAYVDAHWLEHRKKRVSHWWILIRLNWHYRVCRSTEYLLPQGKTIHKQITGKNTDYAVDSAYLLPPVLIESSQAKRCEVIFLAYRNEGLTGGGGGVCTLNKRLMGDSYNGSRLKYYFKQEIKYPDNLECVLCNAPWAFKIVFWAAYYSQQKLDVWSDCSAKTELFFVCHDLGSAYGIYLKGKKYVLVYHQQGSLVNEIEAFGVFLNDHEKHILNATEEVVMKNAETVYFPSNGAKEEYISTCCINLDNVNFGQPLYNTVLDLPVDWNTNTLPRKYDISNFLNGEYELFLTVGDYNLNKGIDRIPAFLNAYVAKTGKKVFWLAAGNKTDSGVFETLLAERSTWSYQSMLLGKRIPHEDIMGLMEHFHFYLMLHRRSVFDLSTLEAMRAGLIPVLSITGGNPEFNQENNAIMVDMNNFDSVIQEIASIDLQGMKKKNCSVFKKYFSPSKFVASYQEMIDFELEKLGYFSRFPSEINQKYLSKLRNSFAGRTAVICCSDSGMKGYKPIENAIHIALGNAVFYRDIFFDMLFLQNTPLQTEPNWIEQYNATQCIKFYGIKADSASSQKDFGETFYQECDEQVHYYELAPREFDRVLDHYEFNLDRYCMVDANHVLFSALQFSVYAGFSKIYLVGIDVFDEPICDEKSGRSSNNSLLDNLTFFKQELRLYRENVDFCVVKPGNKTIENTLGLYDRLITVTGVSSEMYRPMVELQKKSCQDNFRFDYEYFTDEEWSAGGTGSSEDSFWGYMTGLTLRLDATIDRINKYWGGLLLLTDADLVFFKRTEEELRRQLGDKDMVFFRERLDLNNLYERAPANINIGFVFMRCNENTLQFWKEVRRRVVEKHGWDQEEVNLILIENPTFIKWGFLSDVFNNGGSIDDSNIERQYICTSCGTVAKRNNLTKLEYLQWMLRKADSSHPAD